jgi:hypothetical protein
MELTKLQIKPLSGLSDWPVWKRRIRDFLDYHDGALSVIDGTQLNSMPHGMKNEMKTKIKQ